MLFWFTNNNKHPNTNLLHSRFTSGTCLKVGIEGGAGAEVKQWATLPTNISNPSSNHLFHISFQNNQKRLGPCKGALWHAHLKQSVFQATMICIMLVIVSNGSSHLSRFWRLYSAGVRQSGQPSYSTQHYVMKIVIFEREK